MKKIVAITTATLVIGFAQYAVAAKQHTKKLNFSVYPKEITLKQGLYKHIPVQLTNNTSKPETIKYYLLPETSGKYQAKINTVELAPRQKKTVSFGMNASKLATEKHFAMVFTSTKPELVVRHGDKNKKYFVRQMVRLSVLPLKPTFKGRIHQENNMLFISNQGNVDLTVKGLALCPKNHCKSIKLKPFVIAPEHMVHFKLPTTEPVVVDISSLGHDKKIMTHPRKHKHSAVKSQKKHQHK